MMDSFLRSSGRSNQPASGDQTRSIPPVNTDVVANGQGALGIGFFLITAGMVLPNNRKEKTMPNHVTHKLTVSGTAEDIQRFLADCFQPVDPEKDTALLELDFNTLVPRPAILDDTIAGNIEEMKTEAYKALEAQAILETGHKNWYDWCCANWGTKWNAYQTHFELDNDGSEMHLCFQTAWACPEPIFAALAERCPQLKFHGYALDEGYGFAAEITLEDGQSDIEYFEVNAGFMYAFGV